MAAEEAKMADVPTAVPEFKGTPHIGAKKGDFAETVLMPGDPARAEWYAKNFLEGAVEVTSIRRISGFTGTYKGKRLSVMASGMGQPSCAIYATELMMHYGVKTIIRIGTCGAGRDDVNVGDLILAMNASTDSSMVKNLCSTNACQYNISIAANFPLVRAAVDNAEKLGFPYHCGTIFSSDYFYSPDQDLNPLLWKSGVLGVEMEGAVLYAIAQHHGCRAFCICTVTDHLTRGEAMPAELRQTALMNMATVASEVALTTLA